MATGTAEADRHWSRLDGAFDEAIAEPRDDVGPFGILYSGGVDSSLLAWELRNRPGVRLYTLGTDRSADLRAGERGAELLGVPWEHLHLDETSIVTTTARFSEELDGLAPVARTVLLSLAIAISQCPGDRLLCGQGVDELFLGYAHYRGLSSVVAERRSLDDLARLLESDWPRTQRIAGKVGKRIIAPYLTLAFREAALGIPIELRLPGDRPKGIFRDWSRHRGLPEELAARPKRALQYGSGVDALVRRRDRTDR